MFFFTNLSVFLIVLLKKNVFFLKFNRFINRFVNTMNLLLSKFFNFLVEYILSNLVSKNEQ